MTTIGFVGTGHIAAPMVRFLAARGHQVIVSERNADIAAQLTASHGVSVAPNQQVLDAAEIIFLCLRPQVAPGIIEDLTFRPDHRIVSVMAGIPMAQLQDLCAPASDISVTIPLGYLEQGGCPLPAFPSADLLTGLFAPENPVFEVTEERALNMHFAVCAMVPGLLDLMATGAGWLGAETGDPAAAEFYTTQLMSGFLHAMRRDPGSLARDRDALATDGTISLQMTTALRDGGAHEILSQTLDAIGGRLSGR